MIANEHVAAHLVQVCYHALCAFPLIMLAVDLT